MVEHGSSTSHYSDAVNEDKGSHDHHSAMIPPVDIFRSNGVVERDPDFIGDGQINLQHRASADFAKVDSHAVSTSGSAIHQGTAVPGRINDEMFGPVIPPPSYGEANDIPIAPLPTAKTVLPDTEQDEDPVSESEGREWEQFLAQEKEEEEARKGVAGGIKPEELAERLSGSRLSDHAETLRR